MRGFTAPPRVVMCGIRCGDVVGLWSLNRRIKLSSYWQNGHGEESISYRCGRIYRIPSY